MYDRFRWTRASVRRNRLTAEYEPLQPFFFAALCDRAGCRTFVDVGANVGVYSLFATLMPTVGEVIAFEADPTTLAALKKNVEINGLEARIRVYGNAVSDSCGPVMFGTVGALSGANSVVSTSIHNAGKFRRRYTVEATTLDAVLNDAIEPPVAMKIDVEGHEAAVLAGAISILRSNSAVIQVECFGGSADKIVRLLKPLGFDQLTAIGTDHYFTNVESCCDATEVIAVYESASREMIDYANRAKPLTLQQGDFKLEVAGKTAELARKLKRFAGRK
jgi:FkbM family methyltransferase